MLFILGSLPMGSKCEEKLSASQLPQLASRAQRLSDHVHSPQNRENGSIYGRSRGKSKL